MKRVLTAFLVACLLFVGVFPARAERALSAAYYIIANATAVGDLIFSGNAAGTVFTVNAAVTAAGTTTSDATVLTSWFSNITTATVNQGVKWAGAKAGYGIFAVRNQTAVTFKLYPPTGGAILGYGTNAGADIAVNAMAVCFQTTSTFLACAEIPNI